MLQFLAKTKESLFKCNVHLRSQVVTMALIDRMSHLFYFDFNHARPDVNVFICRIFKFKLMSILGSCFNVNPKQVDRVYKLIRVTNVASACNFLSLTIADWAFGLELLHKTRHDLLLLNDMTLTAASMASFNMVWVITATSSAMRADNFLSVLDFVRVTSVQVFKSASHL